MNRREMIGLMACTTVGWPMDATAQQFDKPRRFGLAAPQPVGTRVIARRWIGRPRLHAGKYILGITAPTGTGVQARF